MFVMPAYARRVPKVVEQWIMKNKFTGSRDTNFVLTCGDSCGNGAAYTKKFCLKKGLWESGDLEVYLVDS